MSASVRSLLASWGALMALTLAMAFAGDVVHASRLGPLWIVLIAAVAAWKSRIVLGSYLGLSAVPAARAGFVSAVMVILAVVATSFLIFTTSTHGALSKQAMAAELSQGPAAQFLPLLATGQSETRKRGAS
ncbi:hypothetical protein QM467_18405 [Rhodoblastus sp. 17X3]|uniref:hypothetical protein n=1 Tax=Rhodoblastus sp. 17X3 TaxID=3047026 RepID=UPI0024B6CF69|nr:hypothetical protein [Rhodoblastus sp. 17X3]MDI9850013.1 hypothetical protein [Rhodoblastus sp. 17X3]